MLISNQLIGFGNTTRLNDAVLFDGATWLTKSTDFSGVTDGKQWTFSIWFYRAAGTGGNIFGLNAEPFFQVGSSGSASIGLYTPGSTSNPLIITIPSSTFAEDTWYNILVSIDLTNTGSRHVYINDASATVTWTAYNNLVCEFSDPIGIGASDVGGDPFNGSMYDFWMNFNQYIDFSIEANRRKFITSGGSPVPLGVDGQIPNGSAPDVFLSGIAPTWHVNKGTGGGFTENGALTIAPSKPE